MGPEGFSELAGRPMCAEGSLERCGFYGSASPRGSLRGQESSSCIHNRLLATKMRVCVYVFMCVCVYVWMCGCVWMCGFVDVWTCGYVDVCMCVLFFLFTGLLGLSQTRQSRQHNATLEIYTMKNCKCFPNAS